MPKLLPSLDPRSLAACEIVPLVALVEHSENAAARYGGKATNLLIIPEKWRPPSAVLEVTWFSNWRAAPELDRRAHEIKASHAITRYVATWPEWARSRSLCYAQAQHEKLLRIVAHIAA